MSDFMHCCHTTVFSESSNFNIRLNNIPSFDVTSKATESSSVWSPSEDRCFHQFTITVNNVDSCYSMLNIFFQGLISNADI